MSGEGKIRKQGSWTSGRTDTQRPTHGDREKLRDREEKGGRGVGERETEREDALRRSQETGVGGAGPPTKGKARPPPNPCPRTRRGHARAHTRHSAGAARAPALRGARVPPPAHPDPSSDGASGTRPRHSPWSPRHLRRRCHRAEPEPRPGGGGRGGPAPPRPPGPRRAPDAAGASGLLGCWRRAAGSHLGRGYAHPPGPARAGSRGPGAPSRDPPTRVCCAGCGRCPPGKGVSPATLAAQIGSPASKHSSAAL